MNDSDNTAPMQAGRFRPGQSGNPDSPHYRDLAAMWSKGEYFPLLYSRKMIDAAAVQRIELLPAP